MEKILGQILDELKSINSRLGKVESNLENVESDISTIKTQQAEHSEILTALRHSSEVHTAKLDKIEVELSKQSGDMKAGFQVLANMYGYHEFEISKLKYKQA